MKNYFLICFVLAFVSSSVFGYVITVSQPKFEKEDKIGVICKTSFNLNKEAMDGALANLKKTSKTLKATVTETFDSQCDKYTRPAEKTAKNNEVLASCRNEIYKQFGYQVVSDYADRYSKVTSKDTDVNGSNYSFYSPLGGVKQVGDLTTKGSGNYCKLTVNCSLDLANGTAAKEIAAYFSGKAGEANPLFARMYNVKFRAFQGDTKYSDRNIYCQQKPEKSDIKFVPNI